VEWGVTVRAHPAALRRRCPGGSSTGCTVWFRCPGRADTVWAMGLRGGSRATGIVLAVVVLAGASGCGHSTPRSDPTTLVTASGTTSAPTTSTSATTAPPPAEPVLPQAAKHRSPAGAKTFARYVVSLLWFTSVTGHTALFGRVSRPECINCLNLQRNVSDIYARGGFISSQPFRVRSVTMRYISRNRSIVNSVVYYPTQLLKRNHGVNVRLRRAATHALKLGIEWEANRWTLGAFDGG
jgi:hypothetical protein